MKKEFQELRRSSKTKRERGREALQHRLMKRKRVKTSKQRKRTGAERRREPLGAERGPRDRSLGEGRSRKDRREVRCERAWRTRLLAPDLMRGRRGEGWVLGKGRRMEEEIRKMGREERNEERKRWEDRKE